MAARVVLTRPAERQTALAQALTDRGFEVLSLPALSIEPSANAQVPSPEGHDWMIFVSRAAWQHYWQHYRQHFRQSRQEQKPDFVWPASCRLAAVGVATAQYIKQSLLSDTGQDVSVLSPSPTGDQDSESLWQLLAPELTRGAQVLIVRGQEGREWLSTALENHGCISRTFEAYRREPAAWSEHSIATLKDWGQAGQLGTWLITSQQGLLAIQAHWAALQWHSWRPSGAVVIHPRLKEPVQAWLGQAPVVITQPDDREIIDALTAGFESEGDLEAI